MKGKSFLLCRRGEWWVCVLVEGVYVIHLKLNYTYTRKKFPLVEKGGRVGFCKICMHELPDEYNEIFFY